jgi:hypothetical protein
MDRVRRDLDDRYRNDRSAWVAALAPLLPQSPPGRLPLRARAPRVSRAVRATIYLTMAAGVLSATLLAIVVAGRGAGKSKASDTAAPFSATSASKREATTVRFSLTNQLPAADIRTPRDPGPGSVDAQSLAEELLAAVQGRDYDAFVAKGSPFFRAAVATARFESLGDKLGARLADGHSVRALGTIRREETVDWLFGLHFSDDGDDALVTLAMEGWQVAGFLVTEPIPLPAETPP